MGFMTGLRSVICDVGCLFSMRHYQSLCVLVIVATLGALTSEAPRRPRGPIDTSVHVCVMAHVGSFAACLGAQLWVILIAGMTMFFILPRHMFGKLQTFLFPMFFLWCLATSGLSLATYSSLYPPESWDRTHKVQMVCMLITLATASFNGIVLSPMIIESMVKTFQFEVEAGAGHIVGHACIKELQSNAGYAKSYSKFRRCHSASTLLNVLSLVANVVYLHYFVSRLVAVQSVD